MARRTAKLFLSLGSYFNSRDVSNKLKRDDFLFETLEDRAMLATFVPGELLIQFAPSADVASRANVRAQVSGHVLEQIQTNTMKNAGQGILERVVVGNGLSVDAAINRVRSMRGVAFAEPNWIYTTSEISNDTHYLNGNLWGMYSSDSPSAVGPAGTTNQYGSQAEKAWNNGFIGSNNVYVAVIDEGIQYTHPDLAANVWNNPFDPIDGVDNDGNGKIDDSQGWDFFSNDRTVYDGTGDDHATHVAGTIGGDGGNGIGVAGVNWNVTMISTKFLGPSGGSTSGAIQALDYVTDLKTRHGLNIIATNNSWGGGGFSQGLLDAITRAANQGILFVAAAGNSTSNNDVTASYPSNYDTTAGAGYDSVIAVASITNTGARSSFSSYGATTVDLGAPGSSIVSSVPDNAYASYSGTSMATPHVTGALALYASTHPGATALSMRNALLANVTATTSLAGFTVTGGRLDVDKLMGATVALPGLSINDVTLAEGNSGSTFANFTVSLSAPSANSVTVNYATSNGSASAGSDYTAASGTITFAPGETTKPISVEIFGDTSVEGNETFNVTLTSPTNATISDNSGLGTINNDDAAPAVSLSINDVTLSEGNSGSTFANFTVNLSAPSANSVTVNYATSNGSASAGSDYTAASGTLTFAPGETTKPISIQVFGDTSVEGNETFDVVLSGATNASISDSSGLGTINNDDSASAGTLSINDVSGLENSGALVFSVTLSRSEEHTSELQSQ